MSGHTVGEAFVVVKPVVTDFRAEVARGVDARLGQAPIAVPIAPKIERTADALTWQKIAGGAVVPVPIQPTITPEAQRAFSGQLGGLRGLLLGGGQFSAARALGISSAAAGLFVFGRAALGAVKSAATLEQELNVFQQVSGATAEQMRRVRDEARALGADVALPAVSAGDAAATMTELAKAGLNVDQVLRGTRGTLQLAAAAQLDFATSSELVANALNAFQLPGAQATKVADLLAGAANAAQGNIADFGIGLSQAAAVAHQAGIPLGETVTFLTELAKAGIQGSDAGTSLRVALLRLIAPSNEAQKIFRELGIELTDAAGNVRTDVFEQLRVAMERLTPATRNAALATIFGADAVRAAAVFVRDGAEGHERLAQQVERSGQAAETAAARTKGLSGSVQGLGSNVETLGTDLGAIAIPALTEFADLASTAVAGVDKLVVSTEKLANVDLGPFGTIGDAIKKGAGDALEAVPGVGQLKVAVDALNRSAKETQKITGFSSASDRSSPQFDAARQAGNALGETVGEAMADGIRKTKSQAVIAASATLRDAQANLQEVVAQGQKAVADTLRLGEQAVADAAVQAKRNLSSLALGLQQQVLDVLDHGPLAQRIAALQADLTKDQSADERRRRQRELREAQAELRRAQAAIAGGGGSAEQRAAEREFLAPFRQRVGDAKAALDEFGKQTAIDRLTQQLEAQKAKIAQALSDIVARFNQGLISGPVAGEKIAALLKRNLGPIGEAGKAQGFAFNQAFVAEVQGLQAQIALIVGGPKTKKTGTEPGLVSPAQVARQAAADVRAAREQATSAQQRASEQVKQAVVELHKTEHEDLAGPNGVIPLLKQIRDQLAGSPTQTRTPAHRPSSSVKTYDATTGHGKRAGELRPR